MFLTPIALAKEAPGERGYGKPIGLEFYTDGNGITGQALFYNLNLHDRLSALTAGTSLEQVTYAGYGQQIYLNIYLGLENYMKYPNVRWYWDAGFTVLGSTDGHFFTTYGVRYLKQGFALTVFGRLDDLVGTNVPVGVHHYYGLNLSYDVKQ